MIFLFSIRVLNNFVYEIYRIEVEEEIGLCN